MMIVQQKLSVYQNKRIAELTEKLYSAENTVNRLSFGDRKTFTATEIAKELNLSSAEKLNTWLAGKRFQYKSNGTWVCYSEFADKGYTEIKKEILANGKIKYNRHFTNKGRDYILLMWEKENTAEKSSADSNK